MALLGWQWAGGWSSSSKLPSESQTAWLGLWAVTLKHGPFYIHMCVCGKKSFKDMSLARGPWGGGDFSGRSS